MVTGELKSKIDGLWEIFWTGGLTNPLDVIEQMTYLMFIHDLDDTDNLRAKESAMLGLPYKSVFKDPVAWYTGEDTQHLIPIPETEPKKYTMKVNNWKAGYTPFNNLCKSINNVSNDFHCSAVYEEAMFYNYFLRPATVRVIRGKKNLSFKKDCTQLDREVAGTALCGIIELDRPDIVIFVSKYTFDISM